MNYRAVLVFALGLLVLPGAPAWAQDTVKPDTSMRDILESEQEAQRLVEEK